MSVPQTQETVAQAFLPVLVGEHIVAQAFLPVLVGENTMSDPALRITQRNLPHWHMEGSTYFVTFRLASGSLSAAERAIVRDHLQAGHGKFYQLAAAVVMPDHVHLLL